MEKSYKVKFYYIDRYNHKTDYSLYTEKELINEIQRITNVDCTTIEDATLVLEQHKGWNIKQVYREITNDDIVNNVKPDNSITNTLNFGEFENIVNKDQFIITEFSTLNDHQKLTVATFLDKNIQLRHNLKKENRDKPDVVYRRYLDIVDDLVYELFLALDYKEAEYIITRMEIFNKIENDILIKFLHQTIENMTVRQLISKEDEFITPISNEFWNKIVEENNKEKELKND